jgi:hypothetical protein
MRIGTRATEGVDPMRAACCELVAEVTCLEIDLAGSSSDLGMLARSRNQAEVEAVAASRGLSVDRDEVGGDGGEWIWRLAKAVQLRVLAVAAGAAAEHMLCEKRLPPEGDEPLRVEIPRV